MFRFPLQRVLDLRERQQRDAAAALAAAQDVADAARRAEHAILSARAELASVAGAAPGHAAAAVGALRTTAFLLDRLDEQAQVAGAACDAASAAVGDREQALHAAYRNRRALDRLRERHQTAWQHGTVAADRQRMDEIALSRFTQRATRPAGSA